MKLSTNGAEESSAPFFISDVDESTDSESIDSRLGRRLLDEDKKNVLVHISEHDT